MIRNNTNTSHWVVTLPARENLWVGSCDLHDVTPTPSNHCISLHCQKAIGTETESQVKRVSKNGFRPSASGRSAEEVGSGRQVMRVYVTGKLGNQAFPELTEWISHFRKWLLFVSHFRKCLVSQLACNIYSKWSYADNFNFLLFVPSSSSWSMQLPA